MKMADLTQGCTRAPDPRWVPEELKLIRQPKRLRRHFREGFVSTRSSPYPLSDFEFAVLDVETSGLEEQDRVIEIAVLRMSSSGRVISEFSSLINPRGVKVSEGASYVNGITDRHLVAAPPLSTVWAAVTAHLAGAIVVAHNAPFDVALLQRDLNNLQSPQLPYPVMDLLYACRTFISARAYRVDTLLTNLRGEWPVGLHMAHADVRAEAEILMTLLNHPRPLYWHGPLPASQKYVARDPALSPAARWEPYKLSEIPSMAESIGRKIRTPRFVAPEILVRSSIRGTRYFAGNDDHQTRSIIRRLVGNGGIEAKRLTSTTRFFIGDICDIPLRGLPDGVRLVDVPWMEDCLAREETLIKAKEAEHLNYLRKRHHEKYANMRYYALGWREEPLSPSQYLEEFPYKRWDM